MTEPSVLLPSAKIAAGDPTRELRAGGAIAITFFALFLGGAALVPLDAGVSAPGVIAVSGNRQTVQHKDGGIVTAIHVREGQHVERGQILVELAAPDVRAAERALTSDYLLALAQRSRLFAERTGQREFVAPREFQSLSSEDRPIAEQVMAQQRAEARARYASLEAQQSVLLERGGELSQEQSGYTRQRTQVIEQQRLIAEELQGLEAIAQKGFASINRVRELERTQAALKGQQASMEAEYARAGQGIGETRMQSLSVSRDRLQEIESDLKDTESKISEVLPKLVATRQQLEQALVRAPATGLVVGLDVFTVGGVVTPGQKLMDIVPDRHELVIQAQLAPRDADDVFVGQQAQIRFVSVQNRSLPLFTGIVRTISADSLTDEKSGRSFFRAEIRVPESELRQVNSVLGAGQLRPGLPVETVLRVRKRTALQYLLDPLTSALWKSGHED